MDKKEKKQNISIIERFSKLIRNTSINASFGMKNISNNDIFFSNNNLDVKKKKERSGSTIKS
tara:strand:- start:84 stop:269 length:186 start_codon:yes stop_codon:yes gene_type:complete